MTLRSVDGLRPRIDQLINVLTAVADDPDAFKSLTSEASLNLLFDAATIGEELHQTFVTDHGITDRFFAEGRVQIISATPESYLPVELFYALRPPTVAKALRELERGGAGRNLPDLRSTGRFRRNPDLPYRLLGGSLRDRTPRPRSQTSLSWPGSIASNRSRSPAGIASLRSNRCCGA